MPPGPASGAHRWCGQWPRRASLELGASPETPARARSRVRDILQEWRLSQLTEDAELLISELLANGIQATQAAGLTQPVRIWLLADRARILLLSWDAAPSLPLLHTPAMDAEAGRGLLLVDAISARWGWYRSPRKYGGKVVWALLEIPAAAITAVPPP
jgi:anti-sigma regulatory factor (Ser/Thr protein kinase)